MCSIEDDGHQAHPNTMLQCALQCAPNNFCDIENQVGDIAYGGGSQLVNNATRHAFQKYLHGQVPVDRVYPVMGNHVGALRGGCEASNRSKRLL